MFEEAKTDLFEEAKTDSENVDELVIIFASCPIIACEEICGGIVKRLNL